MPIWTILAVVLIVVLGTALVVSRGTAVRRARSLAVWSETELDYRSRNDRVPNLEHTLSAYAFHQRRLEAHPAQVIPSPQLVTGARALLEKEVPTLVLFSVKNGPRSELQTARYF
jgi:hypothetical protein